MLGDSSGGVGANAEVPAGQVFSTHDLPASEQFEAWRQHVSEMIELSPAREPGGAFPAQTMRWQLGDLIFTRSINRLKFP
ncbi:hypothetical protein FG93_04881 [Bosea sp. LC85]|nr:hypothetical protein FG93_04881 [Bosea sp. LC85]